MRKRFTLGGLTGSRHPIPANDIFLGGRWGMVIPPYLTMRFLILRSKGAGGRPACAHSFFVLELKYFCWMSNTRRYFWGLACARLIVSRDEMQVQARPTGTRGLRAKFPTFQKFGLYSTVLFFNLMYWSVAEGTEDVLIFVPRRDWSKWSREWFSVCVGLLKLFVWT